MSCIYTTQQEHKIAASTNGAGINESINLANQPAGVYYIKVYGYGLNDFNPTQCYSLNVGVGATCNTPFGLSSSAISSTGATVSWGAVSGASNYTVEYKTTAATVWTTTAANTILTTATITGLSASTAYDWRVRTNCSSGSSSNTQAQFTTIAASTGCVTAYEGNDSVIHSRIPFLSTHPYPQQ